MEPDETSLDSTPAWSEISAGDAKWVPRSGGRFRTLRSLAQGGMGEVFVALDTEFDRNVALKEMRGDAADDPGHRARFLYEAEITGLLEHPGIAPVYSLGVRDDGRPFYAMKLIQGKSLEDAIAEFHSKSYRRYFWRPDKEHRDAYGVIYSPQKAELRRLIGRFVAVCRAVAFAHSKGIIHRDIKPLNIMIGEYGESMIVDWGLARRLSETEERDDTVRPPSEFSRGETATGARVGTPRYMSPEQASGMTKDLGVATDVYGLGGVLYTILTGKPPISGKSLDEVLNHVRNGVIEPLSRIDPRMQAICMKALALRPEDRYPSVTAFADDVDRWVLNLSVTAYRENLFNRFLMKLRERFGSNIIWPLSFLPFVVLAHFSFALSGMYSRHVWSNFTSPTSQAVPAPAPVVFAADPRIEVQSQSLIRLLRMTVKSGSIQPGELDSNKEWAPLRTRADFRKLRQELGLPADPLLDSPRVREILDLPADF